MSNKDNEKDYDNLTDSLNFILKQFMKTVWVSIPGVIETYDQETKRCKVKPAINIQKTDGTTEEHSAIINVPVVWPSGGGFTLLSPLPAGSPVEIKFSQRGITQFKESFSTEDPGKGVFVKEDAHVFPSYGALSVTPATADGMTMQTEDGTNFVFVENGNIEVTATSKITANAPNIIANAGVECEVNSPLITINGDDIETNGDLVTVNATEIVTDGSTVIMNATTVTINANLIVNGNIDCPTGTTTSKNMDATTSLIVKTKEMDDHKHPQGPDSPSGDTQQNTGGPI